MLLLVVLFIIILIPIYAFPACKREEQKVDILLILGCPTRDDGSITSTMTYRLDKAIELDQKGYCDRMILCGGKAHNQYSEAESMRTYLEGKVKAQLILEDQSTTTFENFKFAKKIIASLPSRRVGILTSNSHANRAYALALKFFDDIIMFKSKEKFSLKKLFREGISRYQYLYIEIKLFLKSQIKK